MTSCFHIIEGIGPNQIRCYVSSSLPGGGTRGGQVCHLRLHLIVYCAALCVLNANDVVVVGDGDDDSIARLLVSVISF